MQPPCKGEKHWPQANAVVIVELLWIQGATGTSSHKGTKVCSSNSHELCCKCGCIALGLRMGSSGFTFVEMTAKHSKALWAKSVCSMGSRDTNSQHGFDTLLVKYMYFLFGCSSIFAWNPHALESCTFSSLFPPYILPHGISSSLIRHSFHSQFSACFWRQSLTSSAVVHWIIMKDVIFYCKFLMKWVKAEETKIMYLTLSSKTQRNARLKFLSESYLTTGFYRVDPSISTQLIEEILH